MLVVKGCGWRILQLIRGGLGKMVEDVRLGASGGKFGELEIAVSTVMISVFGGFGIWGGGLLFGLTGFGGFGHLTLEATSTLVSGRMFRQEEYCNVSSTLVSWHQRSPSLGRWM